MSEIADFYIGDNLDIEREVTNVPVGQTITNAWFTVKRKYTDLDADAVMQKAITGVSSAAGIILDTGADGTGRIKFTLLPTDTVLFSALSEYIYDIQIKTSAGGIYTKESGTIIGNPQITITTGS